MFCLRTDNIQENIPAFHKLGGSRKKMLLNLRDFL